MYFGKQCISTIKNNGLYRFFNDNFYFLAEPVSDYQACVICMEDFSPRNLRQHNACDCVMCAPCLDRTIEHHQGEVDFDDPSTGKNL